MQGNEFTFPSLNIKILNKNQSQQGMQKKSHEHKVEVSQNISPLFRC